MAAPDNVNSEQFDKHQEALSSLESAHGIEVTDRGIALDNAFIPTSNYKLTTYNPNADPAHEGTAMHAMLGTAHRLNFKIPSESPRTYSNVNIWHGDAPGYNADSNDRISVREQHHYPHLDPESGGTSLNRHTTFANMGDALESINQASSAHAEHVRNSTTPTIGFNNPSAPAAGQPSPWTKVFQDERQAGYTDLSQVVSPNSMSVSPDFFNPSAEYQVDTRTGKRIPGRDQ